MKGRECLKYVVVAVWLISFCNSVSAQESQILRPELIWMRLAEDQFAHSHWELARRSAHRAITIAHTDADSLLSRYYSVVSTLELDQPGADDAAVLLMQRQMQAPQKQLMSLSVAQYYFRKGEFDKAIPYYTSAGISNLSNDEIADARFELAYSHFTARQFGEASPLFAAIRDVQGKYYAAGNYYYALLAYNDGNYTEALNSFKRIEDDVQYRNIVPYYIAEIYYFNGDRDMALQTATSLIRREEKLYYDKELYLLAAQVLFEEGRYGEALPFFENYYDRTEKIRKEELYEMAYSYYSVKEWQSAIDKFRQLSTTSDSLGQTAMYLLGDSYLRTGDKKSSRSAFGIAAGMDFNRGQQEAALLLHAKLSYELGYDDDAVRSLTQLILDYPQSQALSEARTILSGLLLKTRNYTGAYDLLGQVSQRDASWWRIHQKVAYGLGTQYLQEMNLAAADSFFRQSRLQSSDPEYDAAAAFWQGEIAMRRKAYMQALAYLRDFSAYAERHPEKDVAGSGATMSGAWLNMGYASMELERYEDARTYFSKLKTTTAKPALSTVAKLREGDALFMLRDYKAALTAYEQVGAGHGDETDYAALQRAILLGVLGRKGEKIVQLNSLIKKEDSSRYGGQARYELALTLIEDDKYQQAISILAPLIAAVPGPLTQKALIRTGFSWQQLNEDGKAIDAYRKAVLGYPASDDRAAALESLKSLYIERNEPAAFAALAQQLQLPASDTLSSQMTYYAAAEAQFAAGKWIAAKSAFGQYLNAYPQGTVVIQAHYYKGEAHYQLKEYADALREYDEVLTGPWNEFSESAARRASGIAEKDSNYNAAIVYYNALRNNAMTRDNLQIAYSGLLKASYGKEDFPLAERYADSLMSLPDVDTQSKREVQFYRARSLQRQGKNEDAIAAYKAIQGLRSGPMLSELGYRIAETQVAAGNLAEAEVSAAANLKTAAGNEYWVVKSYLLIADILVRQRDYFNAKATLTSVIANTKNVALKTQAKEKLVEVKKLERSNSKLIEE